MTVDFRKGKKVHSELLTTIVFTGRFVARNSENVQLCGTQHFQFCLSHRCVIYKVDGKRKSTNPGVPTAPVCRINRPSFFLFFLS
jgi:hypothetical protein